MAASGCQLVVGHYTAGEVGEPDAGTMGADTGATVDARLESGSADTTGPEAEAEAGPDVTVVETGTDAAGCTPGAQQCSGAGSDVETCTASGTWGAAWPCATGLCAGGGCSGATSGASNPSCTVAGDGLTDCGAASESCCTSDDVVGGTYDRTYASSGGDAAGLSDPATVSGLRMDRYLVTVGRFRQFVQAWNDGDATPAAHSGKHVHLNGGQGLVDSSLTTSNEGGWDASDDGSIQPTDANLMSCIITSDDASAVAYSTWTPSPAGQETLPINCINWYEAYAFCIWDGGFLPSEAELEYAAAAGSQQREYPWGGADPGTSDEYAIYGCNYPLGADGACTGVEDIAPVGSAPSGAGAWGQVDLAGDMYGWTLDAYAAFVSPCDDCAYLGSAPARAIRGGAFAYDEASLLVRARDSSAPAFRNGSIGVRCARTP
jgi:formylglycine-generating enzyme required for sulfatase activity